mmetsp:Transcript_12867/g.18900  ORF Transcript_12867/g.18900 Transcript_12867/m.18900 type:complete len:817 (+) Transcript_12867:168-2618(+)
MVTIREYLNKALDHLEAIDLSPIASFFALDWVRSEWFQWRNHYFPIALLVIFFWPVVATLILALTAASTWLFWLLTSIVFGLIQLIYVMYQFVMIFSDILILSLFKTYSMLRAQLLHYSGLRIRHSQRKIWKKKVAAAGTYENFLKIGIENFHVTPVKPLKHTPSLSRILFRSKSFVHNVEESKKASSPARLSRVKSFDATMDAEHLQRSNSSRNFECSEEMTKELGKNGVILVTTTSRLREARQLASMEETVDSVNALKYMLSGVVKRNHLTLDEILVENARSVSEKGKFGLSQEARNAIRNYFEEVEKCLDWVADSPLDIDNGQATQNFLDNPDFDVASCEKLRQNELKDRFTLIRKMKQNMGRTALMLSGGGAQAMYHLGTIRALIESNSYGDIKVISGTSGGSITAGMCAIKTTQELFKDVCVPNVSTDFLLNGEMKKKNIRWFPPVMEMGAYWLKKSLLVDSSDFKRCCDFYFGDFTFEEAFERTGKHVCITVTANRASGGTAQRLLLNHISTPHVTIASAVAASCALPGVMAPAKLLTKDSCGKQEPFEVDGVEWIDGSVQADLPFERISTLFNVSNYIVAQTNFHVVPFLNKEHHPGRRSLYWRLFQTVEWDIRNRALKLSKLGLFPRLFGQDISKVFKQKYHGNLTLVPRFTAMQTFGLKALANPTYSDMENYLKYGQIAAWPYLNVIADMLRLERALDNCLDRLQERQRVLRPDWDDMDSITSAPSVSAKGVRFSATSSRAAERLKQKVVFLERENFALKVKLEEMQRIVDGDIDLGEENKVCDGDSEATSVPLTEKTLWNLIRTQK